MTLPCFSRILALATLVSTAFAEPSAAIFPFEPAQLLGVLPPAPTEWKITRSDAETTLGEWMQTTATRVYQAPPPPAGTAEAPAALPPGEVEIAIVDTTSSAPSLTAFANFIPAKSGDFEKKLIGSLPAIVIGGESGRQLTQVLVSSRYIVEITLTNLPRHRAEDWLRLLRFDSLPPKSKVPASRSREFLVAHLDELHPENNRSYAVSTTNAKRVDDFLKTLPLDPEPAP